MAEQLDTFYTPERLEALGKGFLRTNGPVQHIGETSGVVARLHYDAQDDTVQVSRTQDVSAILDYCEMRRKESARQRSAGIRGSCHELFRLPVTTSDEIHRLYGIDPNDDDLDFERLYTIVRLHYPKFLCVAWTR